VTSGRQPTVDVEVCDATQLSLVGHEIRRTIEACESLQGLDRGGPVNTAQAIVFGMMLSWTPSIALLAWLLWREKVGGDDSG
jgi:hypothetical protein